MKFFDLFNKKIAEPQMTPLETALLESLKKEPELWKHAEGKTPQGDTFVSMTHREKGVTVNSRRSDSGISSAWNRELYLSDLFAIQWNRLAGAVARERDARDRATRAEAVAAEMKKRIGVTS